MKGGREIPCCRNIHQSERDYSVDDQYCQSYACSLHWVKREQAGALDRPQFTNGPFHRRSTDHNRSTDRFYFALLLPQALSCHVIVSNSWPSIDWEAPYLSVRPQRLVHSCSRVSLSFKRHPSTYDARLYLYIGVSQPRAPLTLSFRQYS